MLTSWKKQLLNSNIPFTNDLQLINALSDSATIGEWNLQGLPNDELSIQGFDCNY